MVRLIVFAFSFLLLTDLAALPVQGSWKCAALTPSHLVLTGDYSELQNQLFQKHFSARRDSFRRRLPRWAADFCFHISGTEAIAEYRPAVAAMLRDSPQIKLISSSSAPLAAVRTE